MKVSAKASFPVVLVLVCAPGGAGAQAPKRDYPSCDLPVQRTLDGRVGGQVGDEGHAHVATRADILQADIGTARKARRLSQANADRLWRRVDVARGEASALARRQGGLTSAERVTIDRRLDAIAASVCRE